MRLLKMLVVLCICAAGPAVAGPHEDAYAAYTKGDYATALRLLRPLADQGDAGAQNGLGNMYTNGQGVPQDYAQAAFWYRKAARQSYAVAQYTREIAALCVSSPEYQPGEA
jgi:TPR repeat protein